LSVLIVLIDRTYKVFGVDLSALRRSHAHYAGTRVGSVG